MGRRARERPAREAARIGVTVSRRHGSTLRCRGSTRVRPTTRARTGARNAEGVGEYRAGTGVAREIEVGGEVRDRLPKEPNRSCLPSNTYDSPLGGSSAAAEEEAMEGRPWGQEPAIDKLNSVRRGRLPGGWMIWKSWKRQWGSGDRALCPPGDLALPNDNGVVPRNGETALPHGRNPSATVRAQPRWGWPTLDRTVPGVGPLRVPTPGWRAEPLRGSTRLRAGNRVRVSGKIRASAPWLGDRGNSRAEAQRRALKGDGRRGENAILQPGRG